MSVAQSGKIEKVNLARRSRSMYGGHRTSHTQNHPAINQPTKEKSRIVKIQNLKKGKSMKNKL